MQLVFLTPAIPSDLEVLARPVTYLTFFGALARRPKITTCSFYADADADIAVHDANSQQVSWQRASKGDITALKNRFG